MGIRHESKFINRANSWRITEADMGNSNRNNGWRDEEAVGA